MPGRSLELKNLILLILIRHCLTVSQLERPCNFKIHVQLFKRLSDQYSQGYGRFFRKCANHLKREPTIRNYKILDRKTKIFSSKVKRKPL